MGRACFLSLVLAALLLLAADAVAQGCRSYSRMGPDGRTQFCTLCCSGGFCTEICN